MNNIRIKCAKCLVFSAKHHKPYSITCTKDHKKGKKKWHELLLPVEWHDIRCKKFWVFFIKLSLSLSLIIIKYSLSSLLLVTLSLGFSPLLLFSHPSLSNLSGSLLFCSSLSLLIESFDFAQKAWVSLSLCHFPHTNSLTEAIFIWSGF